MDSNRVVPFDDSSRGADVQKGAPRADALAHSRVSFFSGDEDEPPQHGPDATAPPPASAVQVQAWVPSLEPDGCKAAVLTLPSTSFGEDTSGHGARTASGGPIGPSADWLAQVDQLIDASHIPSDAAAAAAQQQGLGQGPPGEDGGAVAAQGPPTRMDALRAMVQRVAKTPCLSTDDEWYWYWTYLTVLAAAITAWLEPYLVAFAPVPGLQPVSDPTSMLQFTLVAIFFVDMCIKCVSGGDDPETGQQVTELWPACKLYLRGMFKWDLLFTAPWDLMILDALGLQYSDSNTAYAIGLLKLLMMGRLYRITQFIAYIEYKMLLSQTVMVLARNISYLLLSAHTFGCIFYFTARMEQFADATWVGRHIERWVDQPIWVHYTYSLYYGVCWFAGAGDNDFYSASAVESILMIVYFCYNVLLAAYILGTVTMLMVKGEKRLKQFRDRITNLREYCHHNNLPVKLLEAMEEHLELHFHSEQASDEQVLAIYPQTIRRRVLRELYLSHVKKCPLFMGCKAKFLDAVLTSGRVEIFLPRAQIITKGDMVNEIYVILEGEVEVTSLSAQPPAAGGRGHKKKSRRAKKDLQQMRKQSQSAKKAHQSGSGEGGNSGDASAEGLRKPSMKGGGGSMKGDGGSTSRNQSFEWGASDNPGGGPPLASSASFIGRQSFNGSEVGSDWGGDGASAFSGATGFSAAGNGGPSKRVAGAKSHSLEPGDAFGEVSFFTEQGSHESVWSASVVKVLLLTRNTYQELLATFPHETRKMLENLQSNSEETVRQELIASLDSSKNLSDEVLQALHAMSIGEMQPSELSPSLLMEIKSMLHSHQHDLLDNLNQVKDALAKYTRKVDQSIIYEFLNSCSGGDEAAVRDALASGMSPNSADYDNRSGLMLACHEGHTGIVKMLLDAGADPQLKDNFNGTAMWECVQTGHDALIQLMVDHGASLGMEGFLVSAHLAAVVHRGDLAQLRRMLLAGANASTPDCIGVTPLHVAATVGNLTAAQLLITEGNAKVNFKNSYGHTPLDEAKRLGHQAMIEYLTKLMGEALAELKDINERMEFLNYCSEGNTAQIKSALSRGVSPDTADYDIRTGLMLACHANREGVVKALLDAGADPMIKDAFGNTAMWECVTMGHPHLIELLLKAGGSLGMEGLTCSSNMSRMIREEKPLQLRMMLRAKTCPDQPDYLGATPLHTACALGNLTAVRLLVEEANATVDMVDALGRTPLDCARQLGLFNIVVYMEPLTFAAEQGRIKNRNNAALPPAATLLRGKGLPPLATLIAAASRPSAASSKRASDGTEEEQEEVEEQGDDAEGAEGGAGWHASLKGGAVGGGGGGGGQAAEREAQRRQDSVEVEIERLLSGAGAGVLAATGMHPPTVPVLAPASLSGTLASLEAHANSSGHPKHASAPGMAPLSPSLTGAGGRSGSGGGYVVQVSGPSAFPGKPPKGGSVDAAAGGTVACMQEGGPSGGGSRRGGMTRLGSAEGMQGRLGSVSRLGSGGDFGGGAVMASGPSGMGTSLYAVHASAMSGTSGPRPARAGSSLGPDGGSAHGGEGSAHGASGASRRSSMVRHTVGFADV